jgi:hypothetical protein
MEKPSFEVKTAVLNFKDIRSYIRSLNVSDFALIKICLISFGILIGALVGKNKKSVVFAALFGFLISYIPIMKNFGLYMKLKSDVLKPQGKD